MPLMNLVCDLCGKHYTSRQCGKHHHFCSIECRRKAGKMVDDSFRESVREAKSKQFAEMNLGENKRLEVMPRDNPVPTPKDSSAAID